MMSLFEKGEEDIIDQRLRVLEAALEAITDVQVAIPMLVDVGSSCLALRDAKEALRYEIEELVIAKQELEDE